MLMAEPVRAAQIPQAKTSQADVASTEPQKTENSVTVPLVAQRPAEPRVNSSAPAIPDLRKRKQDQIPADAFDPEIFNRQFLHKPEPASKKPTPPQPESNPADDQSPIRERN